MRRGSTRMSERPKRCIVGACESPIVISRAKVTRGRGMSKRSPNTVLGRRDAVEGSAISALVRELGSMIDAARKQVASAANAALTTLYWQIGHRVRTEVLAGQRAEYGAEIVAAAGDNWRHATGAGSARRTCGGWYSSQRSSRRRRLSPHCGDN